MVLKVGANIKKRLTSYIRKRAYFNVKMERSETTEIERKEILKMYHNGMPLSRIADKLGKSKPTVWRWLARYHQVGHMLNGKRSGRPRGSKNVTPKTYSKKENLDVPPTERPQLKRLNSEESCTSSLKDVPVKIKRITAPLEKVVSDARRGNEDSASTILLRIEAKLDKALLEIEDVKARLSSIEEKFEAEFGRQQVTQPDVYPIQSVKTFYELECDSFEKERKAQQKYLQNLRAKDIQSFVDVAFEKSIADDVIQNHFTLHGTDSKDKLEGTEFLNMIYCAAKRSKSFLGPTCLSELFPYVQETVSIIERLSNVPRRPEQTNDDSAVDPLQECNINISPHNEGNHSENEIENTGQSNYASDGFNGNEITFIKVEEESIVEETDEKPDLFVT